MEFADRKGGDIGELSKGVLVARARPCQRGLA
jgi:hypothetical protein